jgi:hypothetical protein
MAKILFQDKQTCNCRRCGAKCKVDPVPGSKAKMLKRSAQPEGLCINCAVHDFLRNTYPVNMLLAGMRSPECLLLPHLQQQFADILKSGFSDAKPDEINWRQIVDNWDLPFPNKIKRSPMNPMNDEDLAREPEEEARREHFLRQQIEDPRTPEQKLEDVEKELVQKIIPLLKKRKVGRHEDS